MKQAITTEHGPIPPLFGLRKDHKTPSPGQEEKGPPTRPVCGASESVNGPLSHILSEILNIMADELDKEIGTECRSTEEMISRIEAVNGRECSEQRVLWSSDVKALYPSFRVKEVAETVFELYNQSEISINIDDEELGLYLALVVDREKLMSMGLEKVTPKWKNEGSRGRRPGITTSEVFGGNKARTKTLFNKPENEPTEQQRRSMVALALSEGITVVMKSHMYEFNGETYLQADGGPIGLELTGAIARVFMLNWDRLFMNKVRSMTEDLNWDFEMYLRYVDDCNCVAKELPPGAKIEGNKIVIKQEQIQDDQNVPNDRRTAKILQAIANTICPFIQVEIDCPSMHKDGLMPILDLKVRIEGNKVIYRYYRKDMANFLVLMARSAMPMKMKRVSLVQEVVRIQRNTSKYEKEEVKKNSLSEFSLRMKCSGYNEKFRKEVITDGIRTFEKQVERSRRGIRPLYRPKQYEEEMRKKSKEIKKTSWYQPNDAVMFCPPTPNSVLAKSLGNIAHGLEKECEIKVKVIERAGRKIRSMLPGLKAKENCGRRDCVLHRCNGKGNCNKEGIVYQAKCKKCAEEGRESIYVGETSRSIYVRGKQHLAAVRSACDNPSNGLAKHILEHHQTQMEEVEFEFKILYSNKKPLQRQVREGVEIKECKADLILNSKLDHYQPAIRGITFTDVFDT